MAKVLGTHAVLCDLPAGFFVRRAAQAGPASAERLYEAIQRAHVPLRDLKPHVRSVVQFDARPTSVDDVLARVGHAQTPFLRLAGSGSDNDAGDDDADADALYVSLLSHYDFRFVM